MYLNLDLSGLLFLVFQISSSSVRKIENTNNNKIKQTYVKGKILAISQAAIHNDAHYFEHGLLISRDQYTLGRIVFFGQWRYTLYHNSYNLSSMLVHFNLHSWITMKFNLDLTLSILIKMWQSLWNKMRVSLLFCTLFSTFIAVSLFESNECLKWIRIDRVWRKYVANGYFMRKRAKCD